MDGEPLNHLLDEVIHRAILWTVWQLESLWIFALAKSIHYTNRRIFPAKENTRKITTAITYVPSLLVASEREELNVLLLQLIASIDT